jgi:hypothetical protein
MIRYPKNWPTGVPKPPPTPKHYYEDQKWISEHMRELREQYLNQWIAVFNGEVIAAGRVLAEVERVAHEKTGERDIATRLIEPELKFYSAEHVLRD